MGNEVQNREVTVAKVPSGGERKDDFHKVEGQVSPDGPSGSVGSRTFSALIQEHSSGPYPSQYTRYCSRPPWHLES